MCFCTGFLSAVATCFAVTCVSNKKIVTAFHNITYPAPEDHEVNYSEPYYIIQRLYPNQLLSHGGAHKVVYKGSGNYEDDWAVLDVEDPNFSFSDTLSLREFTNRLPQTTELSLNVNTLFYKIGLHRTVSAEFMEATTTHYVRVDHVYTKTIELPFGLYSGACGAPMLDEGGFVVAIHVESISEVDFPNKRIKVSDVASEVSSHHSSSRWGKIVFNNVELRTAIDII